MFRKALTNFIIMALILLPVQVLSAGIENSNMQMKMQLKMSQMKDKAESKCMHQMAEKLKQQTSKKSCCDEHSNQCKSCNNCPPVVSAMVLSSPFQPVHPSFKKQTLFISHLLQNGTPQKNLLRPPRHFI
jgi:hypothetical protein